MAFTTTFFATGLATGFVKLQVNPTQNFGNITVKIGEEQPSPKDRIKQDQIHVFKNYVRIDVKNVEWSSFTDTNSMDPVLDEEAHALEIIPKHYNELQVGDIASYTKGNYSVIHRIAYTGWDEQGWYAIFKGDNNEGYDVGRIRFNRIRRVVIGVIY